MENYFFDKEYFKKIKKVLEYSSKNWKLLKPRGEFSFNVDNYVEKEGILYNDIQNLYTNRIYELLKNRRSSLLSEFDGKMTANEALYLIKTVFEPVDKKNTTEEEIPLFSYPTAGGLNSITPYVFIKDIEGIIEGIYEIKYNGIIFKKHLSWRELELLAPITCKNVDIYNNSFEKTNLIFLFISKYDNIFSKYGLLSYRLLHIEAGHIAQNLQLVATDMGLKSLPLGGWFDDMVESVLCNESNQMYLYSLAVG